jgi:hypothetical protein
MPDRCTSRVVAVAEGIELGGLRHDLVGLGERALTRDPHQPEKTLPGMLD